MMLDRRDVDTLHDNAAAAANFYAERNDQPEAAAAQWYVEGVEDVLDFLRGSFDHDTLDRLRAHGIRGEEGPRLPARLPGDE